MASESEKKPVENKKATETKVDETKPVVAKEPKKSFDERTTGANQPWLNEDGSQNNG